MPDNSVSARTAPAATHAGRVAVVTGAARGLGAAIARGLARRGATVAAVDLTAAERTQEEIEQAGGTCVPLIADVSDPGAVRALHEAVRAACGPTDILVNNAGIAGVAPLADVDFAHWRRVLATNLDSQFLMATAFAADMRERGWGRIVNMSSSSIYTTTMNMTPYMASKAGILGLTSGLANDLAADGITVNAVSPAFTRTPLIDETVAEGAMPPDINSLLAHEQAIKRQAVPEDMVGTVLFLTGDDAEFVTAKFIAADGGYTRNY
ncbi:SDR family NAD(P)-dependent oxidoreductase [Streptomyces sp. NBC_00038]|uniref:SDR family NAD(P)-dependent oxidoreductase n=1 Tax=Streptomyces sp. NBC_00038 TaxID=2903615 RepID=UPI00224FD04A|nr:SDR family oxidoreductase [Streptomyces sp. NBC_00038]MCX5555579.1 SDR family oxidoreductase [Streptomyces sp. NBC_00038]